MANATLIIISLTAPPEVCGVSDYALSIAGTLKSHYNKVVVGLDRVPANMQVADTAIQDWRLALKNIDGPCDILLNYTPRGYHNLGMPITLLTALKKVKKANSRTSVFAFFHEVWDRSENLKLHHRVINRLARHSYKEICKMAGGIAVITPEQEQLIKKTFSYGKINVQKVGANILPADRSAGLTAGRTAGIWIIFGLAHTRLWTLEAQKEAIEKLKEAGLLQQIRAIGPVDNPSADAERTFASMHFGEGVLVQTGALQPYEVTQELLHAYGALVGQSADSLKKSGSFAAIAAHAVPVVCNVSNDTTDPPGNGFFSTTEMKENARLFEEQREARRKILYSWFWNTRSWEAIGANLAAWMQGTN